MGKKHTEETKRKISQALLGNKNDGRGELSRKWKGGKRVDKRGYVLVRVENNPTLSENHNCNSTGYIPEHRLVMENYLGRKLDKYEFVHHRNGIKNDNRIENLEIVFKKHHYGMVRCPYCLKDFLIE